MCGRYVTISSVKSIEKRFQVEAAPDVPSRLQPNANVSHGEYAPVITSDAPGTLQLQQFGFTPRWAKKQFYMINARSEGDHNSDNDPRYTGAMGILQKPMFRQSIRDRRCLIVADAIIEGPRQEKLTKPYLVYARNGLRLFAMAGIWDEWTNPSTGEITRSFAILTTVSNRLMERIGHHRSPVILHEENEQDWINPSTPLQDITALMRPYPEHLLNAYPISPAIRDPRVNGSDLLQPIGQRLHPEHHYSIHQDLELFGMGDSKAARSSNPQQHPGSQGALFH
jgi:putative SOS response-associated peptidase YedK